VDTSVWVDYLRGTDSELASLLTKGDVHMHTLIIGELACGNLNNRGKRLADWHALPSAPESQNGDVLQYIEDQKLMGRGIGLVDAHLLYAATSSGHLKLWTRDARLMRVAEEMGVAYVAP
jgi:hypothetical protein